MIRLDLIRHYGSIALALLFLVLWQRSERQETKALEIAAATVETTHACVTSYGASADAMGAAVDGLTTAIRAQ